MLPREQLRKADIIASLILIALGGLVLVKSYQMPWASQQASVEQSWYISPGLFPLVISALLIVFSALVLVRAIKDGGLAGFAPYYLQRLRWLPSDLRVRRIMLMWLIMGVYIFALLGRLNYYIATSAFLLVFMLLFYRDANRRLGWKAVATSVVIAVSIPLAVGYVFSTYLLVPLPS